MIRIIGKLWKEIVVRESKIGFAKRRDQSEITQFLDLVSDVPYRYQDQSHQDCCKATAYLEKLGYPSIT